MSRNRRIIYNDDATLVEESITPKEEVFSTKVNSYPKSEGGKELKVHDVVDSFAGYLIPRLEIQSPNEQEPCVICGGDTSKGIRKICFNCMLKYKNELYNGLKHAIENRKETFEL